MKTRVDLHNVLKGATECVVFQPDEKARLVYPCIVYNEVYVDTRASNNKSYIRNKQYSITYMTKKADDSVEDYMFEHVPHVRKTNVMVTDGVYHEVYRCYI